MVGMEGSLIQENIPIVNKFLDSRLRSGEPGVMYKIDFTKTFDHVAWEFLDIVSPQALQKSKRATPRSSIFSNAFWACGGRDY